MPAACLTTLTTAALVLALLLALARRSASVWIFKPLASLGFVATTWLHGGAESPYGRAILAAQLLGLVGDICLLVPGETAFRAGLGTFLLGHLGLIAAFSRLPLAAGQIGLMHLGLAQLATLALSAPILRWLWPHLPAHLRAPVLAYVGTLSAMLAVAMAVSLSPTTVHAGLLLGGAVAFYAADILVARDTFVRPRLINQLIGLPLYYGAQLAFAWSC